MFIHFCTTKRERAQAGVQQRERETQNPKQAPGSELSAQSPTRPQTHKPQDHDLSRSRTLNQLSHPDAPGSLYFLISFIFLSISSPPLCSDTQHINVLFTAFKSQAEATIEKWGLGGSVTQVSDLGSGHDLTVCEFEPASVSVLIAQSLEPASDSVSPSHSDPPLFMLCLSPSQK